MSFDLPGRPPVRPPTRPSDTFRAVRVVGTVTSSDGSDCVEVTDDNGVTWGLVGLAESFSAGDRVEASGMPLPEGHGGCSGAPVRVTRVVRLDPPG